ncbi:MAG: ASCH domain-containing protein [Bacilli bacterium]|nr:ASCH domain-containing protein [Bacilli bacterium]
MKVLTLFEPYATLIKEKTKYIETRSWKTFYRGELYIHVSKKHLSKIEEERYKEILKLIKDKNFKYGYIIAKCNLVDCVIMDDEFLKKIKNSNQEKFGIYAKGRYAWILENIEPLDKTIEVKGKLGIWNYESI